MQNFHFQYSARPISSPHYPMESFYIHTNGSKKINRIFLEILLPIRKDESYSSNHSYGVIYVVNRSWRHYYW